MEPQTNDSLNNSNPQQFNTTINSNITQPYQDNIKNKEFSVINSISPAGISEHPATPDKTNVINSIQNRQSSDAGFNGTHYLLMYAISLGLLVSILTSLSSLLEICFNSIGSSSETASNSSLSGYTLKLLVWLIINLVISVVVYVLLLFKIRIMHINELPHLTRRVRSLLFGVFMSILGLAITASIVNLVYSVAVQFLPKDGLMSDPAWWVGTGQAIVLTLILGATYWYQLKTFRSKKGA